MKVFINALGSNFRNDPNYLGRFLSALTDTKSNLIDKPEYLVVTKEKLNLCSTEPKVRAVKIPEFLTSNLIGRFFCEFFCFPIYFKIKGVQTVVTWSPLGPVFGVPNLINFQTTPEYFSRSALFQLSFKSRLFFLIKKCLNFVALRKSHKIVVPSEFMASEIQKAFPDLEPERLIVFPPAVESPDIEVAGISNHLVSSTRSAAMTFFYPCYLETQKGLDILFRGLGKLKRIDKLDFRLLLPLKLNDSTEIGTRLAAILHQEQIKNEVVFLGGLTDRELDYVFRNSTAVVFTSRIESFSYPLAQALSYSLPAVASDTPVNREICQNGALYYSSQDSDSLALQLKAVYNPQVRKQLSQEAKSQFESRDWSWSTYVREFEKLL